MTRSAISTSPAEPFHVGRAAPDFGAFWDEPVHAVRFHLAGGALDAAITCDALEMLAGRRLPTALEALREFHRHRLWIEMLATVTMEERGDLGVVLMPPDVEFQLACEAEANL